MQIIGMVAAISLSIGFGSGFWLKSTMLKAEYNAAVEKELEITKKQVVTSVKIEAEVAKKEDKTKILYKTIIKKVTQYVPVAQKVDSECNLSADNIRLLNMAVGNGLPQASIKAD